MGRVVVIGSDLQQLGRIRQPMDFIEDDAAPAQAVKKALWIHENPAHAGKFTVEVLDFGQALAEASFPHPPHP